MSTLENNIITGQELKTQGTKIIAKKMKKNSEAFITIRGNKNYVVMTLQQYNYLRECELEAALQDAHKNIAAGKHKKMSVDKHIQDLKSHVQADRH